MSRRAEVQPTSSAELQKDGREDRPTANAEPEDSREAPGPGSHGGEPPSIDEIRLEAYYRYLQRDDGNEDEIADWLEAESDLRGRADARAHRRQGLQP